MHIESRDHGVSLPAHLPSLDGIRGAAILAVLLHQFDLLDVTGGGMGLRAIDHALDIGWVGVQLFFVLSGFLITGILLDTKNRADYFRSFYIRRALRIFPLYFGALVVLLVVLPGLGVVRYESGDNLLAYWFFLSNWTGGGTLSHFWSLALEEQFYLVWPLVVLRLHAKSLLGACLAMAVASLALRSIMVIGGVSPETIYVATVSRMDALALGGAAAAFLRLSGAGKSGALRLPSTWWALAWATATIGCVVTHFYPRTTPIGQTIGYSLLAAAFSSAVLALALGDAGEGPPRGRLARMFQSRFLKAAGTYSFGMYVFHKPLHDFVGKPLLQALGLGQQVGLVAGLTYIFAASALTFLAGVVSYWCYERRFLALKDRWTRAPTPA